MLPLMTAEQFVEQRFDLPDAGQWAELTRGEPTFFQPPDLEHGNVILNLSKALGTHVQAARAGYACFELGLAVARRPDTIRFPAACYFLEGKLFAESDKAFTDLAPALVIELASTNDRRKAMADRVREYFEFGVPYVWLIDPHERCVHLCARGKVPQRIGELETLNGDPPLRGFRLPVVELFHVPDWWK
jgi:Uma2 family endonuclease